MEKIPSFELDHINLKRGVYVSRQDRWGDEVITTFDIRMKEPNREPVLGVPEIHTLEHLIATYLRNDPEWKDRMVYWGPMGCLTGNYLLMKGDLTSKEILPLLQKAFRFVRDFEGTIPGTEPRDCGNCLLHNLPMARFEADKFLKEVLDVATEENLIYPQ